MKIQAKEDREQKAQERLVPALVAHLNELHCIYFMSLCFIVSSIKAERTENLNYIAVNLEQNTSMVYYDTKL